MPSTLVREGVDDAAIDKDDWLRSFHAGSPAVMADFYATYFSCVDRSVGRILHGADKETVIHEVFCRLLADSGLRQAFRGGSVRAWIATVARNHAVDYRRRQARERPSGTAEDVTEAAEHPHEASLEGSVEARELIARFRQDCLPDRWRPVFDARFLEQRPQAEAARVLGIHRTTLLYREFRIRQLLRKFVLKSEAA